MKTKAFLVQMPLWEKEPSIALAQLYAFIRTRGYETEVMDVNIGLYYRHQDLGHGIWSAETSSIWSEESLSAEIMAREHSWIESEYLSKIALAAKPFVGFSVSGCSYQASLIMARWIKEARPDAAVVFGGQIFTTVPHMIASILRHTQVDAVVTGDGEPALADLLDRFETGRSLDSCLGAWLRDSKGAPVYTGDRPYADLDDLPFADYSPFQMELYGSQHTASCDLVMMTNRGCVRRCSFCGHRVAWKGFRQMSGERVAAEIAHQRKVMPTLGDPRSQIKFYDLLINGDMKKLGRLCELLVAQQSKPLEWRECNAVIRPEMTEDFCRKLYAAGCRQLIIGLESGSQKVLDSMDKGQTVEQMKSVLKNIHASGLKVRGNFMFGHPGETEEDFQQTLDFLSEMHPYIDVVFPSYTLAHLEGRLIQDPERWDVPAGQDYLYWESKDGANTYPVRLERFMRFRELAKSLGAHVGDGLEMPMDAFVHFNLARWSEVKGENPDALEHYRRYLAYDGKNEYVQGRVAELEKTKMEMVRS